jgi:opacity protein-like surface antigen
MKRSAYWFVSILVIALSLSPVSAAGEWYVAGQVGANFADRLTDVEGTGILSGLRAPDFDLKNAVVYGGKLGYFSGNGPLGVELDVFNSQPNIKNLDDIPGIHLRVTNVGLNLILRYPGQTFQPYIGLGGALLISHLSNSATTQSDNDVSGAFNMLAGLRAFVTPYVALFGEYKYTRGTLTFSDAFPSGGGFSGDYRAQYVVFGVSYHF